jgi:hypothetical protein
VAAEAVAWAAEHRRRELWVGRSTVKVIMGNQMRGWLCQWYDRYRKRSAVIV